MGIPVQGELDLGINYAPERVRIHGLRDAHTFPLVSPDRGKVQRSYARPCVRSMGLSAHRDKGRE